MTRPGASRSNAVNCAASTALGTRPTRATSVPRNGPSARAPGGPSRVGQRAEDREGGEGGPLRLAHGPDVVVAEHAVDAGRDRPARPRTPSSGVSRKVGSTTPVRITTTRPGAPRQAAPTAPARSPKAAGTIAAAGRRSPPSTSSAKAARAASTRRSPACTSPPPSTKHSGSSTQARLARPKPTHHPTCSITRRAAGSPAGAAAETSSPRTLSGSPPARAHHLAAGGRPAPPRGPGRPARRPRRNAPSSRGGRRGRRARPGRPPCGRSPRRSPPTPTWTRPSTTIPPPMPGAEGHHHDVAVAPGRTQTVLGQHGEVGVVLDEHGAGRAGAPRSARSSPPRGPAAGWARSRAGPGGRPCPARRRRRAGGAAAPPSAAVELGHHLAPRPRPRGCRRSSALPRGVGDPRLGHDAGVGASSAMPSTLVPPMSTP